MTGSELLVLVVDADGDNIYHYATPKMQPFFGNPKGGCGCVGSPHLESPHRAQQHLTAL